MVPYLPLRVQALLPQFLLLEKQRLQPERSTSDNQRKRLNGTSTEEGPTAGHTTKKIRFSWHYKDKKHAFEHYATDAQNTIQKYMLKKARK